MRYTVWGHPVEITYTTTILSKVRKKIKGQNGEIKRVLIGKHLWYNRIFVYLYFYCAVL